MDNRPRHSRRLFEKSFRKRILFSLSFPLKKNVYDNARRRLENRRNRIENRFTISPTIPFHSRFTLSFFLSPLSTNSHLLEQDVSTRIFFRVSHLSKPFVLSPPPLSFDTRELRRGFRQRDGHGKKDGGKKEQAFLPSFPFSFFPSIRSPKGKTFLSRKMRKSSNLT